MFLFREEARPAFDGQDAHERRSAADHGERETLIASKSESNK
jgi:hypothetical protein